MSISAQVKELFLKDFASRVTQKEMSSKYGMTQPQISRLLAGKSPYDGISIRSIDRAFPNAYLAVDGNTFSNTGVINGNVTQNTGSGIEEFRSRLLASVLKMDLPAESVVKVMKLITEAK